MLALQRLAQLAVRAANPLQPASLPAAAAQGLLNVWTQPQCVAQLHGSASQRDDSEHGLQHQAHINRMLYRSKQRGFLELDLLIGMWAEKELPGMGPEMARDFDVVLDQENPDMFKWLTAQEEAPKELRRNRAFRALQAHVQSLTDKHHKVPRPAGEAPKQWVRGWTDTGTQLGAASGASGDDASSSSSGDGSQRM
ncbi:Succinate dehydrogenase assembly factor 2 [Chlorella vulgaris]